MNLDFWLRCLFVAVGMGISDALWTIYISKATEGKAIPAGAAGSLIILVNSYVVIEYIGDRRLVAAAVVGAFVGTILPIWWKNRRIRAGG